MKAERSPLQLINFYLFRNNYEFIEPEGEEEIALDEHFREYPIDIDFGHEQIDENRFSVPVKIKINKKKNPYSGYQLFIEGAGIFYLDDENLDERLKYNLTTFSSVNIVINQLRNIIATETSYGPFGKFILPPIDIQALFKKKEQQTKRKQ